MCVCGDFQVQEKDAAAVQEDCMETSSPTVFVNTRRGRGNGTKRKISDSATVTECEAQLPPSVVEVLHIITSSTQMHDTKHMFCAFRRIKYGCCSFKGDTEVAASSPKKRKVSPAKDSDRTETEPPKEPEAAIGSEQQQPDVKDEAPVRGDTGQ